MPEPTPPAAEAAQDGEYDLFSRLYTKADIIEAKKKKGIIKDAMKKPDHWPADTEPDPAKWVWWLPEGWGQGVKITSGGKTLKCYVGPPPDAKRYFHKVDIEKYIGYKLPTQPPKVENKTEEIKVRDIHDTIPGWPEGELEEGSGLFLPEDWRIAWRRLPTTLHKIWIPPGQDEGFLYQKPQVVEWLRGTLTKLSPFGSSRPMKQISAEAVNPGQGKKRKHHRLSEAEAAMVDGEQFDVRKSRCENVASKDDSWALPTSDDEARAAFTKYRDLLHSRGFTKGAIEFAFVQVQDASHTFAAQLQGIYYRLQVVDKGTQAYQKLHCTADALMCDRVYLCQLPQEPWQICTMLKAKAPRYAYCKSEAKTPLKELQSQSPAWMVREGEKKTGEEEPVYKEMTSIHIMCEQVDASEAVK